MDEERENRLSLGQKLGIVVVITLVIIVFLFISFAPVFY